MKFSIIIPIYNSDKYLYRCLDSILNQTVDDFEVILINDGSTDNSPVICDEYVNKDSRFKVIHQKNNGVSAARNAGLKIAKGEWLCFVDSDDEIKAEWLENYAKEINDNVDIVIQGASVIEDNNIRSIQFSHRIYSHNDIADLITCWQHEIPDMGSLWTKTIRSAIIRDNNILFNTTIKHYEDWVFFTYCLLHIRNIVTTEAIGYIYYHCNSTLTGKNNYVANTKWRLATFKVRYEVAQQLKDINESAYWIYMEKISQLMMQTIYQIYKENYPKHKRLEILKEFSSIKVNNKAFNIKNKIVNILWIQKHPYITDSILSFFRFV